MKTKGDVEGFLKEAWPNVGVLSDDTDILEEFRISGDDACELMERFEDTFGVDMANYRWYFHHGEEAAHIGTLFIKPPNRRVNRIPITPRILVEAAQTKRWSVKYPEHKLPPVRWDVVISNGVALAFLSCIAGIGLWKYVLK